MEGRKIKSFVGKYLYTLLAGITYLIVHESTHIIQAIIYDIYQGIKILPLGIEVKITEPLTISGIKLAAFSGLSSMVTLLIGYVLFFLTSKVLRLNKQFIKNYIYYVTFFFLLIDPVYISLISFVTGGDINGIALGLNLSYAVIRAIYLFISVINGYLVYGKLYPAYVIRDNIVER